MQLMTRSGTQFLVTHRYKKNPVVNELDLNERLQYTVYLMTHEENEHCMVEDGKGQEEYVPVAYSTSSYRLDCIQEEENDTTRNGHEKRTD